MEMEGSATDPPIEAVTRLEMGESATNPPLTVGPMVEMEGSATDPPSEEDTRMEMGESATDILLEAGMKIDEGKSVTVPLSEEGTRMEMGRSATDPPSEAGMGMEMEWSATDPAPEAKTAPLEAGDMKEEGGGGDEQKEESGSAKDPTLDEGEMKEEVGGEGQLKEDGLAKGPPLDAGELRMEGGGDKLKKEGGSAKGPPLEAGERKEEGSGAGKQKGEGRSLTCANKNPHQIPRSRKVDQPFKAMLESGDNPFSALQVTIELTEPFREELRVMGLVLGSAPSEGNNCLVYSAEKSRANEPWEDRTTAQEVSTIRVNMIQQLRNDLKERAHDSPLSREERDLGREVCEIGGCLAEVRTWYEEVGLGATRTDKELQSCLSSLLEGPEHELAYQLLDKVLDYTEREPVMLRGIMLQQLAEWYKRPVVLLVPSRDSESGAVSVVGMVYSPKQEQPGAVPLAVAMVPLDGTIDLNKELEKRLDHFCPLARVQDLGARARTTMGDYVVAQLERLPLYEEGVEGKTERVLLGTEVVADGEDPSAQTGNGKAKIPAKGEDEGQAAEVFPEWGHLENLPLQDTSPGHVTEATVFINCCDAAIDGSKDAAELRRLHKARDTAVVWVKRRFALLQKPQDHPFPVEDDMQTDVETAYAKALHAATSLVSAEQNDSLDSEITFRKMLVTVHLATVLHELEAQLNFEQWSELDSIIVRAMAHSVGLQSRFEKACSQAGKDVEMANLEGGFTVVAYGKKSSTEVEKVRQLAVKTKGMNDELWKNVRDCQYQHASMVKDIMGQTSNHARIDKRQPPGPSTSKMKANQARKGGTANTPPVNG
jgi:hypothetical protein